MSLNNFNKMSEIEIDAMNNVTLELNENFIYPDNYTMSKMKYDTAHGKSIYSNEIKNQLPFDSDEDESIQELKKRVIEKMNTFY